MQNYDPATHLHIGNFDGDRLHAGVGQSVKLDAGYKAYFSNQYTVTEYVNGHITQMGMNGPALRLDELSIKIDGASEFDTLSVGTSSTIRFSNGLNAGSEVRYVGRGYDFVVGTVAEGSSSDNLVVKVIETLPLGYVGHIIGALNYTNTATDQTYSAQRDILVSLRTKDGVEVGGKAGLSVSSGAPVTYYSSGDETIVGTDGNDTFYYQGREAPGSSNLDSIDGRGGHDTLYIQANGEVDLGQVRNIEQIIGTEGRNRFMIDVEELASLKVVDLKGSTDNSDGIQDGFHVSGSDIDLQEVALHGVEHITVRAVDIAGACVVKVDDVKVAQTVWSLGDHSTLVLTKGSFTSAQRAEMYGHNFKSIISPEAQAFVDTFGTAKRDVLRGGSGDNVLNGGGGNDLLSGKSGRDVFIFDNNLSKKRNVDKIMDYSAKSDTIQLDQDIFDKIAKSGALSKSAFYKGVKAHDRSDRIIYDDKKGALYYDADGTGKIDAVQFATLTNKAKHVTEKDFFIV
ncbi:calcium-binding protein [Microvirga lenta]|uniref:calcium-binding protein n=1 Tax=Microvirga lenta TaxID=2881337 RepID=UPI001CFF605B|nr:calcium-binding protein [Microvirga lenta]MCB5176573.1 hypothetical protein [Microvirga lenta]